MHPSSPTQHQIASKLGISQSLVSRALSGRASEIGASRTTITKIRRMAAEWNYQPSTTALALRGAPTRTIGVSVKDFDDPYFGSLIRSLQSLACERGNSLLLTGGGRNELFGLKKHCVDGVILAGSDFQPAGLRKFIQEGTPVVQIGTGARIPRATQIHMDEETGIGALLTHLAGLGHSEIGFIAKPGRAGQRRGEILRRLLRKQGHSVREKSFLSLDGSRTVEDAVKALPGLSRTPTAIIAAEDTIALTLLRCLHEAGWSVPQDISVVGIDDISAAAQSIPPLTTLQQPIPEMVPAAFDALTLPRSGTVLVPGKLIIRRSCAPCL